MDSQGEYVILFACGYYNPPTKMHFRMFERARDYIQGSEKCTVIGGVISLITDNINDAVSLIDRKEMLRIAIGYSNWIKLGDRCLEQFNIFHIKNIIIYHQNQLNNFIKNKSNQVQNNIENLNWIPDLVRNNPNIQKVKIKFLCGPDLLQNFSTNKLWSENDILYLLEHHGMIVVCDEDRNCYKYVYDSDILNSYLENITIITEWIPHVINSSRIRTALRRGESIKYFVHDDVIHYIERKNLYSNKKFMMDSIEIKYGRMDKVLHTHVILISCGSYNPPTDMHLRMFERARDHIHSLGSQIVVGGVISPVNDSYGKKDLASSTHRCHMLKLALQNSDWIRISTWETQQNSWTRTRKSLQYHQDILNDFISDANKNRNNFDNQEIEWIPDVIKNDPSHPPVQLKLLCGADLLESFATPNLWLDEDITEIVGTYGLIVITREGSNPYKFIYDSDILSKYLHNILIVTEWIPNEVSSTRIRRALRRGESVKYLLQDSVIEYIYDNGIYNAKRTPATKLDLSCSTSSSNYFTTNDAKYDNACVMPSPRDTMETPYINENVIIDNFDSEEQKNMETSSIGNNVPGYDNTELVREKFFRSLSSEHGDTMSSLTVYQSLSKPIISSEIDQSQFFNEIDSENKEHVNILGSIDDLSLSELPSSAKARNEILAFEDTDELNTLYDNSYSDKEEGSLSITYEENSDDLNDISVKTKDYEVFGKMISPNKSVTKNGSCENDSCQTINSEDTMKGIDTNDCLNLKEAPEDMTGDEDKSVHPVDVNEKFETLEVPSRKSSRSALENPDTLDNFGISSENSLRGITDLACEEDLDTDHHQNVELNETDDGHYEQEKSLQYSNNDDAKIMKDHKKEWKFLDKDFTYTKRLRMVINQPDNSKRQLKGSLDSINLNEHCSKISGVETVISKKSKSFEHLKRNVTKTLSFKDSEISYTDFKTTVPDNTIESVMLANTEPQAGDFCKACLANEPPSTSVFYTTNSNASSPGDEDSTECDICTSCNLKDSNEAITNKNLVSATESEICEICGEPASEVEDAMVKQEAQTGLLDEGCKPSSFSLFKAKSDIEVGESQSEQNQIMEYKITACGRKDCRIRSSLEACFKPEPLYVNVPPRNNNLQTRGFKFTENVKPRSESISHCEFRRSKNNDFLDFPYIIPKDELVMMPRIISKRLSRKGSCAKSRATDCFQERRRYSSVENLQHRMSFKSSVNYDQFIKPKESNLTMCMPNTSVDNIHPKINVKRSFRSSDNVDRFNTSLENLDLLEEIIDPLDAEDDSAKKIAKVKIRDSDTIKMILTKHGIKIISQKETVL